MLQKVKGLIFDCDGVLFESHHANLAYYNAVLQELDEPPVLNEQTERAHLCHTAASPQVFAGLLGEKRVDEAMAIASRLDYRQFIPWMIPAPDLTEALKVLSGHLPLAIATNRGFSMPQILEHFALQDFFQEVVTSRDVARPKPHPDMLVEAAKRLNLGVDELLFIGDSELDRKAAASIGMLFAAYRQPLQANLVLESHLQLVEMLQAGGAVIGA